MGERTEKVEKILEKYEKKQKQIEKSHGTKSITEQIEEVNKKISENNVRIERLQNKLSELSPSNKNKALREEYQKQIEGLENGFFDKRKTDVKIGRLQEDLSQIPVRFTVKRRGIRDQIEKLKSGSEDVWVDGKKQYLEEKQKLEDELKEIDLHQLKIAMNDAKDRLRASLIREGIAIDKDLTNVELEMQKAEIEAKITYQKIKDFDYKYEEYNVIEEGHEVTKKRLVNQKELDRLNAEYEALQNNIKGQKETLEDLQEAKAMCEKELAVIKKKDAEEAKALSKAWNYAKHKEEESKEVENGKGKGTEGQEQGQQGQGKEDKGNKGQNGNKMTWHPDLTEEQIDELKAEGIEPGDPEYDAYLKNHGLDLTKQEKDKTKEEESKDKGNKGKDEKKQEWHPGLTEEQIDELKAEGIEPGDPEYDAYLKNYGLNLTKQGDNKGTKKDLEEKPTGKKDENEKWHPDLTGEQIDELKAEGLKPGDQEYDMYIKNQGIAVPPKCNIHIGRKGFISYNGQEYKISKKAIKDGVNIDSLNNKELEQYLKEDIGIKGEKGIETVKQLIEKGLIDMTIVHAIHSTSMPEEQKRELIQRYEHKALYAQAGKEYPYMDIAYDMNDLSKASLFKRMIRQEVNSDEKEKILKNATKAGKYKMGRIIGKYKPNLRERFLNRRAGKQPLAFPVKVEEENSMKEKKKQFKEQVAKKADTKERGVINLNNQNKNLDKFLANVATNVHASNEKEAGEQSGDQR